MKIIKHKIEDFSVLKVEGRFDSASSAAVETEIDNLYNSGQTNIVFDFSGMNYISSSGLRVFLIAQKKAIATRGKLHLCNMPPSILETFSVTGFSDMFKIYNTLEEAIKH